MAGGVIVFGINDRMEYAGANRFPNVNINRDLVAGIIKKYLDPTFQCDVQVVSSRAGNNHPIIVVPPHGAAPICAKAGGPEVNGKPRGIAQGVYYTRKPGPESAAILTSAEWAPIVRRCAMHERTAIISAIDGVLRGSNASHTSVEDSLKLWHDAARLVYEKDVRARDLAAVYSKSFQQLSYAIARANDQVLNPDTLIETLRQVNGEVRDLVASGWSMFYPFAGDGEPFFRTDENSGQGNSDFLECALLRATQKHVGTDMWRVSPDGKATIIRAYWEDDASFVVQTNLAQGTWFSPPFMVGALAELVRHARGMAERFDEATAVQFRCEWRGLENRILYDPLAVFYGNYQAKTDRRITMGVWPIGMLSNGLEEIVTQLGQPVVRMFTSNFVITPDWVRGQRKRWRS
jgi:hypothetical protein